MPPIFRNGKPFMTATGPAYSTDCCCKFVYKKCSDDSIFGYNDTDIGDYIWHIDSGEYIKLYQDGEAANADDMRGCSFDPSKASCAALSFEDFDFGFDVADNAAAACWLNAADSATWNGTDVTITGGGGTFVRYQTIISTLGADDFRMEMDITGFGGFNSGMPAGAGKTGALQMNFLFDNGAVQETYVVEYRIVGSNWEGRIIKSGGGTGNGTTVHETIGAGVPSTPFTFFIDVSGTTVEIGNEGNWSSTYSNDTDASAVIGSAATHLRVLDGSAAFGLDITLDEMRFTP